jgi:solute:Na+ symporter, SSS family
MWPVIVLIAYGAVLLGIAFLSLKYNDTLENFLVAGRKQRKVFVVASMLASTIGGGITIGTVASAYRIGFAAFWFVASGGIAHFLQGALLSRRVRESEALTLPDLANRYLGPAVRTEVAVIILITWIGLAAAQFVAAAKIITTLSGLPHGTAVLTAAGFLIVYTLIGGQKSVLRTDLFQFGVLAAAILITLGYLFLAKPPAPGAIHIELFTGEFTFPDLLYQVVVMGGSYFICPMMFSRILSADSPENARKSSFLSGTGMFIFAVAITFIGLWAKASLPDLGGLDPLNSIARNQLPSVLGIVLIVGLLAAILSTADTVLITAAGILEHDIMKRERISGVRLWTVAVGAVGAIIALYNTDIIGLLMKTYNGYTAGLVPVVFIALMLPASRRIPSAWAFTAIAGGYALGMAGSFTGSKWLPLIGMAFSAGLSLAGAFIRNRRTTAGA